MRLGTFGTDSDHLVHFRGESNFSILVGFWRLRRLRGVLLFDEGLQTMWQTLKQVPVAAAEVVWNRFYIQNVRLDTFGTEVDRLVHFRGKVEICDFRRILASQAAEGVVVV